MQNQIYRGVVLKKIQSSDEEKSNNSGFIYRGILYVKLAMNKIPSKNICMSYRGNFYNKFFG